MILLDTNIISEVMRSQPDRKVLEWLRKQRTDQLNVSAITVAEIRRGLALLPDGRRRARLEAAFEHFLDQGFKDRVCSFTAETTLIYAPTYRERVEAGLGIGELDLLIAATARQLGADLATRNIDDFKACGLKLINPWTE